MVHYTPHVCSLQIIKLVVTLIYFSTMNLYNELIYAALYTTHVLITNYEVSSCSYSKSYTDLFFRDEFI